MYIYNGKIYSGGYGLAVSPDGGTSWEYCVPDDGMLGNEVWQVCAEGSNVYALHLSSGISVSTDSGATWNSFTKMNGLVNIPACIFTRDGKVYLGHSASSYSSADISISEDFGQTWRGIDIPEATSVKCIAVNESTIYAGSTTGLFVSEDNGISWQRFSTDDGLFGNYVNYMYINSDHIYLLAGGKVNISTDDGTTWKISELDNISEIWLDDTRLYALRSQKLYFTEDIGESWESITVIDDSYEVQEVFAKNNIIGVRTSDGLHFSVTAGRTWVKFDEAEGRTTASLRDFWFNNGKIYAATSYGISIFEIE
jgi:photosystem II stability/assembly factor-like uncharacterized protein